MMSMNFFAYISRFISNKEIRFNYLCLLGFFDKMSDERFLKMQYKMKRGKELHLKNPTELDEKLQWLKLYNHDPRLTVFADKYLAKKYVGEIIGEKYIVPLLGVYQSAEEIHFAELPDQFVIKCNHNSGEGMVICKDKSQIDEEKVRTSLQNALRKNYYKYGREWAYKNINKRIIAEKYLKNEDGSPIADYKFYCFGGKPRYFMYSLGEASHNVRNHKFDMNLNSIDHLFKKEPAILASDIKLPDNIDEMIGIVEKLCADFQHVRVDLYNVDGKVYFGEMTFYTGGGYINMVSKEYKDELAGYIDLDAVRAHKEWTNND